MDSESYKGGPSNRTGMNSVTPMYMYMVWELRLNGFFSNRELEGNVDEGRSLFTSQGRLQLFDS